MKKSHQETPQVDANRRRLTKAGLATPAVLGTLASKQVLGVPFYCTVSGQVSGNVSAHGPDTGCSIANARSPSVWVAQTTWPITKTTIFNGYLSGVGGVAFPNLFWVKSYGNGNGIPVACRGLTTLVSSGNNGSRATLPQVLTLAPSLCDAAPTQALLDLARAAIATVLNAASLGTQFPLDQRTAIAMFIAASSGVPYFELGWLNKHASWNASEVYCYFRLLYGAVNSCDGLASGR